MKPHKPVVLLAAATLGAAACLGDEKYHIEMHQFESEPQMSRAVWVSTLTAMPVMLSYSGNWFTTK
jgi:hypothetical protein